METATTSRSIRRVGVILLLAGAILVPGIRAVSARQERPAPTVRYVVRPGDTLWRIAGRVAEDGNTRKAVHELLELNRMHSPVVFAGQVMRLPAS
jgi:nucleoid-associated protein YgaU